MCGKYLHHFVFDFRLIFFDYFVPLPVRRQSRPFSGFIYTYIYIYIFTVSAKIMLHIINTFTNTRGIITSEMQIRTRALGRIKVFFFFKFNII
jgi:hypothetical protein